MAGGWIWCRSTVWCSSGECSPGVEALAVSGAEKLITTGCEQFRICAIGELSPIESTKGVQENVSANICEPQ